MSKLLTTPPVLCPAVAVRRGGHGEEQAEGNGAVKGVGVPGFDSTQPLLCLPGGRDPNQRCI